MGKKRREKPAPEEVKSKEAEGEEDNPQLFGGEEGDTEAAPEESEEGDEINDIGKEGGTGRACETPAGYEPKVEQDGRGGEEDDKEEMPEMYSWPLGMMAKRGSRLIQMKKSSMLATNS